MAFQEFHCKPLTGNNMNGGSDTGSPSFTATNGNWDGTSVYTTGSVTGVSVNQWASVFADGSTTPTYYARVTASTATTVTLSTTSKFGAAPASSATGISIRVGGAWKGSNGTTAFPYGMLGGTATDASGNTPRANFYADANYAITSGMTHGIAGPVRFQGCTSSPGDGGRAVFDGGSPVGSSFTMASFNGSATGVELADLAFQNNGDTGNNSGLYFPVAGAFALYRVVVASTTGSGVNCAGGSVYMEECEVYNTNNKNNSNSGGIINTSPLHAVRCYSHGNPGTNSHGFSGTQNTTSLHRCVSDGNGGAGFALAASGGNFHCSLESCDAYNNASDGLRASGTGDTILTVTNCNLVKNGGWGVNVTGTGYLTSLANCGFVDNTSGTVSVAAGSSLVNVGQVNYGTGTTPYNAPTTGDFRITAAAAKGAGRGAFTETQNSKTGTVGYPDIGAAQHQDSGSGNYCSWVG